MVSAVAVDSTLRDLSVRPALGAARYGRCNSRGRAVFADTLLSARCVRFGGHDGKPAVSEGGA
jgi:6-phosphogluconate dehydrogenase (decarboxylating)